MEPEPASPLCECEGFEVVSPDGRVGVVDHLLFDASDADTPVALIVRVGLFARGTVVVDARDVSALDRLRRRVSVPASPRAVERLTARG